MGTFKSNRLTQTKSLKQEHKKSLKDKRVEMMLLLSIHKGVKFMGIPKHWLHIGTNQITIEGFQPIINDPLFPKPIGGIWASPFQLGESYYSQWHEFSDYVWGNNKREKGVVFTLHNHARVYVIDSQKDLIQLIDKVGMVENHFPLLKKVILDFEKAKELYDVIYLTKEGQSQTRYPMTNRDYNLMGWDCESCLILNPMTIKNQVTVSIK
jgi:hypothetical protein